MLQKMGWKEDKGLGKNETGIADSLKTKKRSDGLGLGVQADGGGLNGWSSTVTSFNSVLDVLNATYGTKDKKKKKKKTENIQVRIK
jgi:hypothetical protein